MESLVDVLAIGAHPDDVEMSAGGTVAQLVREGKRVAIVDCTRGEMGTRGSAEQRVLEAQQAARILGVQYRECLSMQDGNVEQSEENVLNLVQVLRHYRPHILLMPPAFERHPDHESVHRLCRTAYFKSGLTKVVTSHNGVAQKIFRPAHMFCYIQAYHQEAAFYVDVTETHEQKLDSVRAFGTQVHTAATANDTEPQTFISRPEFMEMLEARARYFGAMIGVRYAEAFRTIEPIGISSLSVWLPK